MKEQLDALDLTDSQGTAEGLHAERGGACGTVRDNRIDGASGGASDWWKAAPIERQVAIVDPAKVGWPLSMIVNIRVEREGPNNTIELIRGISRHEAVAQFYDVTGDTDYVAILRGRTMADFEDFLANVLGADLASPPSRNVVIRTMTDRGEVPL